MALNLETIGYYALGGALLGSGWSLYKRGFFNDLLGNAPPSSPPPAGDGTTSPPPTTTPPVTEFAYYAKRKYQCRDAHLTFAFLASQGVRVLNYKVYNDGLIYNQICNTPGPLWILVAIAVGDGQSGAILTSLGFVQYFAPPSQPNPNIPLPNPPNPLPSSNYAMAYIGSAENHNAYVSYAV